MVPSRNFTVRGMSSAETLVAARADEHNPPRIAPPTGSIAPIAQNLLNSRRVISIFTRGLVRSRFAASCIALFLRAPQSYRKDEPSRYHRQGTKRNCADLESQPLQTVKNPSGQRVRATVDNNVYQIFSLIFLCPRDHPKEHLARRSGDREVQP